MEPYIIQPWGDVEGDVPTVPPELEAMTHDVMREYDMTVSELLLITTKPDKGGAIWKIQTNHGPRSLKVLHRTPQRSLYSVHAQQYLVEKGARVPGLIRSKAGELCVERGGKLWIVTDWIEPLTPAAKVDLTGAAQLCCGLGEFHQFAQGYVPPEGAQNASRLYRYPMSYQKILTKLDWFRQIAMLYSDLPASGKLLSLIDKYERQARNALYTLEQSPYKDLVQRGEAAWGFAHQDYGWSNGQVGPDGKIWIIDLDGVAYDLPIRDLRKLITSTMEDMGHWDLSWIRGMIDAYQQANPIEPELMQVLLIDMAMPNEFYKHVKEVVYEPELFLNAETEAMLDRMEATDATKWPALQELGANILEAPADWVPSQIFRTAPNVTALRFDADSSAPALVPISPEHLPEFDRMLQFWRSKQPVQESAARNTSRNWWQDLRERLDALQPLSAWPPSGTIAQRREPRLESNIAERARQFLATLPALDLQTVPGSGELSPYTHELIERIARKRKGRQDT
ncbi:CotS family spore coat protein [Tumebacillus sp. BK434]|uniref:CotS family spore coat protein n=1 Tax=Tumebacillus sp. BK434 TaxID=2512169 RepID=UPI001051DE1F|nr:CotS family spore coat protein [Tumebacillus sp. BK434]TCP59430.1 CotS family spore coat protein [Tumebacillus sp. BK434]